MVQTVPSGGAAGAVHRQGVEAVRVRKSAFFPLVPGSPGRCAFFWRLPGVLVLPRVQISLSDSLHTTTTARIPSGDAPF